MRTSGVGRVLKMNQPQFLEENVEKEETEDIKMSKVIKCLKDGELQKRITKKKKEHFDMFIKFIYLGLTILMEDMIEITGMTIEGLGNL